MLNMAEKKVYHENRMSSRELLNRFNKLIAYGNESQIGSMYWNFHYKTLYSRKIINNMCILVDRLLILLK